MFSTPNVGLMGNTMENSRNRNRNPEKINIRQANTYDPWKPKRIICNYIQKQQRDFVKKIETTPKIRNTSTITSWHHELWRHFNCVHSKALQSIINRNGKWNTGNTTAMNSLYNDRKVAVEQGYKEREQHLGTTTRWIHICIQQWKTKILIIMSLTIE